VRTSTADADRRAAPRFTTELEATIASGGRSAPARLANLSAGGAALVGGPALAPGAAVALTLPDGGPAVSGAVVAQESDLLSIAFREPGLAESRLAALVERGSRRRAA
jgi:hypothetical protein